MHDSRRMIRQRPQTRLGAGVLVALFLSISAVTVLHASGEYNTNPTYCHTHWIWDPPWYLYQCWLPDPPEMEGG